MVSVPEASVLPVSVIIACAFEKETIKENNNL